ncbi:DUF5302 domain-containing protein [Sphaerisporangium sp. TRM90804]|uniref:DUF5302 domain-containing protein n=1 Tax=Sphaerisporangium sp. TRM90804 TaxID=3031113 RepID=UPI00244A4C2F|nr:DUF5302 domain-containing protein [Sphaerisporangium sp. TRM90804]MDH2427454.1 DUF5302 domain-containing protein [Sphaerisporangium sp. TRM90804]
MTADASGTTADEPEQDRAPEAEGSEDELKRKFREALDRKRQNQAESNDTGKGKGGSKIHGTHGPAASKRSFRRKSGG